MITHTFLEMGDSQNHRLKYSNGLILHEWGVPLVWETSLYTVCIYIFMYSTFLYTYKHLVLVQYVLLYTDCSSNNWDWGLKSFNTWDIDRNIACLIENNWQMMGCVSSNKWTILFIFINICKMCQWEHHW